MFTVWRGIALSILLAGHAHAAEHCVILQYHHVDDETPGIPSVPPDLFQQHLDYLASNQHVVLPLHEIVDALRTGRPLPERCVGLTIDDAYVSTYREVYPRAARHGFPLSVFVSTDAVDQGLAGYLTWDQMREMQRHDVSFENHGRTHRHLIRQADNESETAWLLRVHGDIAHAQQRIQAELGRTPHLFAYPYGEYNQRIKGLVLALGLTAFGQQSGAASGGSDFGALPRFPMASVYASMRAFPGKVNSLPLPIIAAEPVEPVVALDEWQPALTLQFEPGVDNARQLTCYLNGNARMSYRWQDDAFTRVVIRPLSRLREGRNRTNCTLPVGDHGQYGWYSHNWFRRRPDGGWYPEPG